MCVCEGIFATPSSLLLSKIAAAVVYVRAWIAVWQRALSHTQLSVCELRLEDTRAVSSSHTFAKDIVHNIQHNIQRLISRVCMIKTIVNVTKHMSRNE